MAASQKQNAGTKESKNQPTIANSTPQSKSIRSRSESKSPATVQAASGSSLASERIFGGISLSKLEYFCSRMATGLRSGVDVLRLLESESKNGSQRHRAVCSQLIDAVRSGESLSDAMELQGAYFPQLLIRMLRAGEHSGRVEHCFLEMGNHYRELKRARGVFLGQITFPMISLGLAICVISLMIFINGFMKSGSMNDKAFDLTGIGLRGGSGVLLFWTFLAFVGGAGLVVVLGIWKNWFQCHRTLVPLVRNIPVIGPVFTTLALSRLSMTLSMMLGAGVDARRSLREALLSTGNYYYIAGIEQTERKVIQGKSLAESLDAPKLLPAEFIQTVEIGELSGSDSESLERLAISYREQAQAALSKLAVVAGMTIWLMIAGLIIFVIFTIFFQILGVYNDALKGF